MADNSTDPVRARSCPACAGTDLEIVFDAGELPVFVGVFYEDRSNAQKAPRGRVTLAFCKDCGLIHNVAHDASLATFEPGYEVALQHSETFRNFIQGVAERLVDRFSLRGKRVLEIGCGDAYFLKMIASLGGNDCVGIDPTVRHAGVRDTVRGTLRLFRDYFGSKFQDFEADFICSLSVLEDIPRLQPFLGAVHAIARKSDAPVYFEVFNGWRAIEAQEVWSIHYEQCNYFSRDSLVRTFDRSGFEVINAATCYQGDQYLFVEAVPGSTAETSARTHLEVPEALIAFERVFNQKRHFWAEKLESFRRSNQRVVLWGTGGKGNTFLNTVEGADSIEYVAEINPAKQGKYMPGTGQEIVPPQFLAAYRPDKIIITNALYETEMKKQAAQLGVDAEFLVA
jgi:SAM-dependent methyltransferase